MDGLLISPLEESQAPEIIKVLGEAYLTNPLNVSAFGNGSVGLRLNEKFFGLMATVTHGEAYVATIDGRVLGMLGFNRYPECLPSGWQQVRLLPKLLLAVGSATPRVFNWLSA